MIEKFPILHELFNFIFFLHKSGDIYNFVNVIITLSWLLIAFLTIRTMQRQIKSSYTPQLELSNQNFYLYWAKYKGLDSPLYWTTEKYDKLSNPIEAFLIDENFQEYGPFSSNREFFLQCHNIGLGAAKRIQVQFDLDDDKIKQIYIDSHVNANHRDQLIFIDIFSKGSIAIYNDLFGSIIPGNFHFPKTIEYILPASNTKNNSVNLKIPHGLVFLINTLFHNEYICNNKIDGNLIPPIKIKLKYQDISGVTIKDTKYMYLTVSFLGTDYKGLFISIEIKDNSPKYLRDLIRDFKLWSKFQKEFEFMERWNKKE